MISARRAHRLARVEVGQPAVGQIEPAVICDPEDRHRRAGLPPAHPAKPARGPGLRVVGAELAGRCGDAGDPLAGRDGGGHDAARDVGFIVRMGPDRENRAEIGDGSDGDGRRRDIAHGDYETTMHAIAARRLPQFGPDVR